MKILLSPHNDDAVLFASFTIQREKPIIFVVFDSYAQPSRSNLPLNVRRATMVDARRREDHEALVGKIGTPLPVFVGLRDDDAFHNAERVYDVIRAAIEIECETWKQKEGSTMRDNSRLWTIEEIIAPFPEASGGHPQHDVVGRAAEIMLQRKFTPAIRYYSTYTNKGRSTLGTQEMPTGEELRKKYEALACYRSQMDHAELGCLPHFLDLREFCS